MTSKPKRPRPSWLTGRDKAEYQKSLDARPWVPPINEVERLVWHLGGPSRVCRIRLRPDKQFCARQTVHKWIKQGYIPNATFARLMLQLAGWPPEALVDVVRGRTEYDVIADAAARQSKPLDERGDT